MELYIQIRKEHRGWYIPVLLKMDAVDTWTAFSWLLISATASEKHLRYLMRQKQNGSFRFLMPKKNLE